MGLRIEEMAGRRAAALGAVIIAAFCGYGAWFAFHTEADAFPAALASEDAFVRQEGSTSKKAAAPARIPIKGAAQGVAAGDLGDPFSVYHGRRGKGAEEKAERSTPAVPAAAPAAGQANPSAPSRADAGKQPAPVQLRGIVSGSGGSIALLSDGKQAKSCAVGELFAGYVVDAIEADGVTLRGAAGTERLSMPR